MSETCEFPEKMASDKEIDEIILATKTVAVVGISNKPERDSFKVAKYLQENGFKIIPINPMLETVLGEKSYPSLKEVPEKIDMVDIFRKPDAIPPIVQEAIDVGAKSVWMQLGLAHNESAKKAEDHGLKVVQSKCVKIEHQRLKQNHD